MSAKLNWKTFKGFVRQTTRDPRIQNEIMQDFAAREKLIAQIHSEIEPEIEAIRKADAYATGGYRTQLENLGAIEPGSREVDFGSGFKLHSPSGSVDCELSETERALVYCAGRSDNVESPLGGGDKRIDTKLFGLENK